MKTRIIITLLNALFLVMIATPATSQNTEQLFQKGIMKEEGEGNLPEAIEIFNSIVEDSNADDALQAKALLHVGLCYEKLGKQEATIAYQKLVSNFPGQKNEVAIARERLSRLILAQENTIKEIQGEPQFTKIKFPGKIARGAKLSPDGKMLTYSSEMYEGSLWKIPVPGNVAPDVAGKPEKLIGNGNVWAWGHTWSADGKWIAYNHYIMDNEKRKFTVDEVHVIPSSGGDPKRIKLPLNRGGNFNLFLYTLSLSPDGKILAYSSLIKEPEFNRPPKCHIYTVPVNGGASNQITEHDAWLPAFSPDGNKIAYIRKAKVNDELWMVSANGNDRKKICDIDGRVAGPLEWSPDSKRIALLNSREGEAKNICLVSVSENGKSYKPFKISNLPAEPSINLAGWIDNNKMGTLLLSPEEITIYTIPSKGGKATQISDKGGLPRWTLNENKVFVDNNKIYRIETSSGKTYEIPGTKMEVVGKFCDISPDGKKLAFYGKKDGVNRINIWTILLKGGTPVKTTTSPLTDVYPNWSPDGKSISFLRQERTNDGKNVLTRLCIIPAEGGRVKVLVPEIRNLNAGSGFYWTSDSESLMYYCYKDGKVKTVPVNNGKPEVLGELKQGMNPGWITITPDGEQILYRDNNKFWSRPVSGGTAKEIKTGLDKYILPYSPDLSPDGEKIAFSTYEGGEIDLWMMENFLAAEKLAQTPEKEPEGIQIKQVWKEPYLDFLGSVSSDGRYLSYIHWGNGDVAVHDLKTNENKILTHEAELGDSSHFALCPKISPDGKKIAYLWWNPNHTYDLKIIEVNNPEPNVIYREKKVEVYPRAWLSENELVTIRQNRNNETSSISVFNVDDGTRTDVKSFDYREWMKLAVSPKKDYIAYESKNENNFDIRLLNLNSQEETPLITNPTRDHVIGWLPGTNQFLFISDRSGTMDLWSVPLINGKRKGPAKQVFINIGDIDPVGFTSKGNCFVGFSNRFFTAYSVPFDSEKGEIKMNEAQNILGSFVNPQWSPDGKYLACIQENKNKDNPWQLTIKNLDSGEETTLTDEFDRTIAPRWSPRGDKIMIFGWLKNKNDSKEYKGGYYTVDVETGKAEKVCELTYFDYKTPDDDALPVSGHEWSGDGKRIYLLFQNDRIIQYDLVTGEKSTICYRPDIKRGIFDISPDRKKLLFAASDPNEEKSRLYTISVEGGDEKEICPLKGVNYSTSAFCDNEGKYIYFTETNDGTNVWRVPTEGGIPKKVWHSDKRAEMFNIHPSGNRLIFTTRERMTEIRKIENLKQEIEKIYAENE